MKPPGIKPPAPRTSYGAGGRRLDEGLYDAFQSPVTCESLG